MIIAGQIEKAVKLWLVGPAGHPREEVAHVNAVFPHIQENKNFIRAGIGELGLPHINMIVSDHRPPITISAAPAAQKKVHGHAPNARFVFAIDNNKRSVSRTFPYAEAVATIGPQRR